MSLGDIYQEVEGQVSLEVFNEVWIKVGEAFDLDPRLIRPGDTFDSFASFDSWDLGKGADALEKWIGSQRCGNPPKLMTVRDLAAWLQSSRPRKA